MPPSRKCQQRIADEANRKRSEAAKEQPRTEIGFAEKKKQGQDQVVEHSVHPPGEPAKKPKKREVERESKAEQSKTNKGAVQRGDALAEQRPDLAEDEAAALQREFCASVKAQEAILKRMERLALPVRAVK